MIPIFATAIIAVIAALIFSIITFLLMLLKNKENNTNLRFLKEENKKIELLNTENDNLKIKNAELMKEKQADAEKLQWIETAEKKLREVFEALSGSALKANSSQFMQQTKEQLKSVLEPLVKDLDKMDKQVQEIEKSRAGAYESLLTEVINLKNAHEKLQFTTTTLSEALKSTTQRARWGEIQLRRIVEIAGMVEHIDFDEQPVSEEGNRPDMIIHLPNRGIIPVDAKAPMDAYLKAGEAKNNDDYDKYLDAHKKAVRDHMNKLSQRSYWSQFELAPEFVIMFIPYESGLEVSFAQDPHILEEALVKKVIIVSPATLLAFLKVISYGWLQLQLAKNASAIANQGKELLERFKNFLKYFIDIGGRLNSSVDSYNKAVGSWEGRLLPSLRKLKEMGTSAEDVPEISPIESRARITDSNTE
jgi:DNA recombination protein RmuC